MLVVIHQLHLVQDSQDAVPQHVVLMKPHSPKSIQENPIDFILEGIHQTPRIDISVSISQLYPKVVSTGVEFQKRDLLI